MHTAWERSATNVLEGKHKGKGPLGRLKHTCEIIKIDLKEKGWECEDWIHLTQNRDQ
jgi:hypothetical protein